MNNTIGSRIRACRKEMGYSQETLAAMLYMKKSTICKYELDENDIPSSVIVQLAKALCTTPNYLLLGDQSEDEFEVAVMNLLSEIKDKNMKKLAIAQLKCIADM